MTSTASLPLPGRVFISHSGEDQEVASELAAALQRDGLALADQVESAELSCVLWSPASAHSPRVRDECARAKARGNLLPIRLDNTELPAGLGTLQALNLGTIEGGNLDVIREEIHRAVLNSHLWADEADRFETSAGASTRPLSDKALARQRRVRRFWMGLAAAALLAGGLWAAGGLYRRHAAADWVNEGLRLTLAAEPQPAAALARLNDALHADPTHGPALYHAAQAHVHLGDWTRAREHLQTLARYPDALDPAQREMAQQLLQRLDGGRPEPVAPPLPVEQTAPADPTASPWTAATAAQFLNRQSPVARPTGSPSEAEGHARALFDRNPQRRLHAMAMLEASPHLISDALPSVIAQALQLTERGREVDATAAHAMNATLALIQRASPLTWIALQPSLTRMLSAVNAQNWGHSTFAASQQILGSLDQRAIVRPRAQLLWETGAADPVVQAAAAQLQALGWEVQLEPQSRAGSPDRTVVRQVGAAHAETARWLRRLAGALTQDDNVRLEAVREGPAGHDDFVVWFSRELCAGGQPAPVCQRPEP